MPDEAGRRPGGCLCGAVRYTVAWPPLDLVTCCCRHCQKQAGSALSVVAVLPAGAIAMDGTLKTYVDTGTSGQPVHRRFCPECGSPVLTETPQAHAAGVVFLKAGTLDATADLRPTTHYWTERAQSWVVYPDGDRRLRREEAEG